MRRGLSAECTTLALAWSRLSFPTAAGLVRMCRQQQLAPRSPRHIRIRTVKIPRLHKIVLFDVRFVNISICTTWTFPTRVFLGVEMESIFFLDYEIGFVVIMTHQMCAPDSSTFDCGILCSVIFFVSVHLLNWPYLLDFSHHPIPYLMNERPASKSQSKIYQFNLVWTATSLDLM